MGWFKQIQEYRQKGKEFKALDANMKNEEGKGFAVPKDWRLAQRLGDQAPEYVGMVNGLVGVFQSMDMFMKAVAKQGDEVKANVPKVGLDKTYTEMKRINREDFLQIIQVLSEYV